MVSTAGHDLGHGVRVITTTGGGLVVHSAEVDFGWRPRSPGRSGSAVNWNGASFEVVAREPWRSGHRWTLTPWCAEDVMRVVLPLDRDAVAVAAKAASRERRTAGLRPAMWLLLPLLGLAAGRWQRRWHNDWGFPATLATWMSSVVEALTGATCLFQLIGMFGGGRPLFAWLPVEVAAVGVVFFPEGLIRLAQVAADSEPVGSFVGWAVASFERSPPEPAEAPIDVPEVAAGSPDGFGLEIRSPIQRRDWEGPGCLRYRDRQYRFDATERLGNVWVYRFVTVDDDDRSEPSLRLLPPRSSARSPTRSAPPSVIRIALLTAAVSLAPARFQKRWAEVCGTRAGWFTALGAGAELIGGVGDLGGGHGTGASAVLFGLFFVVEAVVRLAGLIALRRPMGSLLGIPLIPVLERVLPAADDTTGTPGEG